MQTNIDSSSTDVLETNSCLRIVPEAAALKIRALDGKRNLYNADKVFTGHRSGNLKIRGLDRPGNPTPEIEVSAYELADDSGFSGMFNAFKKPLAEVCLTQDQISEICSVYPEHLNPIDLTFALFRRNENLPAIGANLFVACISVTKNGPAVHDEKYHDDFIWYGNRELRIFVPRQA